MLTLSRPQRQALATLGVIALTMAPTGFVGWMAWQVNRPEHTRDAERALSRELGLNVSLTALSYPRPGTVRYRGVVVRGEAAPSTSPGRAQPGELARADTLLLERSGGDVTVRADGLHLRGPGPRQGLQQLLGLLPRLTRSDLQRVSLIAPSCEIELGPDIAPYQLRDLAGTFLVGPNGPSLTASYRIADGDSDDAVRCEVAWTRERATDGKPTDRIVFRTTDGSPAPARVLDPFFDAGGWIGALARVEGELVLQQTGAGDWEAAFQGALLDVDLATLVGRIAPQRRIAGRAKVVLSRARWADQSGRGPGWVEARGTLSAAAGTVSTDFLRALTTQLGFRLSDRLNPARADQEFHALGLAFQLTDQGEIQFSGALGPEFLPGAVLVQNQRIDPLMSAPEGSATVAGLIRTLIPEDQARPDLLIPARFESLLMQRYLPAPPKAN